MKDFYSLMYGALAIAVASLPQLKTEPAKQPAPIVAAPVAEAPLAVGPPPDLVVLTSGGELFTEPTTQTPAEAPPRPKASPKQPQASGQWVTRYAGIRGRRSYVEWVPAAGSNPNVGLSCSSCR